jgi:hypothetical protein
MLSAATKERPVNGDVTAEIVRLAVEGLGDEAIARELGITCHRVGVVVTENAGG